MVNEEDLLFANSELNTTPQQAKKINDDLTLNPIEKQDYLLNPDAYEEQKKIEVPSNMSEGQKDTFIDNRYNAQIKDNIKDWSKISFVPMERSNNIIVDVDNKRLNSLIKTSKEDMRKRNKEFREGVYKSFEENQTTIAEDVAQWGRENLTAIPKSWKSAALQNELSLDYVSAFREAEEGSAEEAEALERLNQFRAENAELLSYKSDYMLPQTARLLRQQGRGIIGDVGITLGQAGATVATGGLGALPIGVAAGTARFYNTYSYTKDLEANSMFLNLYDINSTLPDDRKMTKDLMNAVSERYGSISGLVEGGMSGLLTGASRATTFGIRKIFSNCFKEATEEVVKKNIARLAARESGELALSGIEETLEEITQNAMQKAMEVDATKYGVNTDVWKVWLDGINGVKEYIVDVAKQDLTPEERETTRDIFGPTVIQGAASKVIGAMLGGRVKSRAVVGKEDVTEIPKTEEVATDVDNVTPPPAAPTQEQPKALPAALQEWNKQAQEERGKRILENIKGFVAEKFGKKKIEETLENVAEQEVANTTLEAVAAKEKEKGAPLNEAEFYEAIDETVANAQDEAIKQQEAEVATAELIDEVNENESVVTEIAEQEQTSKLKKEDEQAFNALKENAREEDERPVVYYVDVDTAQDVIAALEDSSNDNVKSVVDGSTLRADIEAAVRNGEDVTVKPDVWESIMSDEKLFQIAVNGTAVYKNSMTRAKQKALIAETFEKNPQLQQSLEDKTSVLSTAYEALTPFVKANKMTQAEAMANAVMLDMQANAMWDAMSPEAQSEYESKEAFKQSVMPEIRQVDEVEEGDKLRQTYFDAESQLKDIQSQIKDIESKLTPEEISNIKDDMKHVRAYKNLPTYTNEDATLYAELLLNERDYKNIIKNDIDNQDNKNYNIVNEGEQNAEETEYKATNEFRELQEESRGLSPEEIAAFHSDNKQVDEGLRSRLSEVFGRELEARSSRLRYGSRILSNPKTNQNVKFYSDVDANTFHDVFDMVHKYLPKGDAVDVHEAGDYQNNKNYLSSDGMSGFSITPSGDLISVFSLGKSGFLRTIQPIVKQEAKTLDCFDSSVQHLPEMYQKTLGFKTASILDFNYDILVEFNGKEYADYFVKTYGESPVHFMVNTDNDIEVKHFNKDQYDEAQAYQLEQAGVDKLLQRTRGVIAGAFTPSLNLIELSKAQNVNTFMHETGHWTFNQLQSLYSAGKMNERLIPSYERYMERLGVTNGVWTTEQQERATEDMSTYLATGKLPDSRLKPLFEFMRNMIMSVWKAIRHLPINKDVRTFFDTLFFTEQEVDNMRKANKLGLLPKPSGWSENAYSKYVNTANEVKNETVNKAVALQDEGRRIRESEDYQRKKQEFYDEKVAELQEDEDYQLRQNIIDNPIYEGSIPDGVALDKKFVTDNKNARSLEQVTAESSFDTMDELINFLQSSQDIKDEANDYATEMADDWMVNEHPELSYTVADISDNVLAKVKTNVYNYMILSNQNENDFNKIYNDMIIKSESEINSTPISIMANPSNFTNSVNSLLNQYRVADFNNNQKKMADLQRRLAAANYMVYRAKQLQRQMKKFSKHFKQYTKKPTGKKVSGYAFDIIHSALNNFGFTARKPYYDAKTVAGRVDTFVADLLQDYPYMTVFDTENERVFFSNPDDVPLNKLSTKDFDRLDADLRTFENLAIEDKGYKDKQKELELVLDVKHLKDYRKGKTKDIGKLSSNFRMMQQEAKEMLPDDLFVKYQLQLHDGYWNAAAFEEQMVKKVNDIAKRLHKKFNKPLIIEVVVKDEEGKDKTVSKIFTVNNMLMMMLHSGNQHNLTSAVMTTAEKFNMPEITEAQYLDIIRQAPDDFRIAANEIWAEFAKTTQPILETGRELNGQEMRIVQPDPIDFGDGGTKLNGGYFPADKIDYKKSVEEVVSSLISAPNKSTSYFDTLFPVYKNKKERVAPHAGLDFDGGTINWQIHKTAQYINVAVPTQNAIKFYKNAYDNGAISESEYKFFYDAIQSAAKMDERVNDIIQFGAQLMRGAALGLNVMTALIQVTSPVLALKENSPKNTIRAFLEEIPKIINPLSFGTSRAKEDSPYMYQRYDTVGETYFGEMQNTFRAKLGEKSGNIAARTMKKAVNLAQSLIAVFEAPMARVTRRAAYLDAIEQGKTEKQANIIADSVVDRFAGSSGQGSRSKLFSSPYARIINPFMSFMMNMSATAYAVIRSADPKQFARFAVAYFMGYTVEQIMRAAFKYGTADDEQKKKLGDHYILDTITDFPSMLAEAGTLVFPVSNWAKTAVDYYERGWNFEKAHPMQWIDGITKASIDIAKYIEYKNLEEGDIKHGKEKAANKKNSQANERKRKATENLGKGFGLNLYQAIRLFNKLVDIAKNEEKE